jgi:hypothetical protein
MVERGFEELLYLTMKDITAKEILQIVPMSGPLPMALRIHTSIHIHRKMITHMHSRIYIYIRNLELQDSVRSAQRMICLTLIH